MKIHTQDRYFPRQLPKQRGFTLVEIMVGLVIGMLATMVVMQVFTVFESQKQTTIGASDALTNGNISFFKIGRDIQSAGYALTPLGASYSPLKCTAPIFIDPALSNAAAPGVVTDIAPVTITNGTSDSITIRYGSTDLGGVPTKIDALAGTAATIKSTLGCRVGDYALVMYANACGISKVTAITPSTGVVAGQVTLQDATAAAAQGTLSCLGPQWHEVTYRIKVGTSTLERRDTAVGPAFTPSVADVVNLQAQYGISLAPNDNQVAQWVDPTGMWADGAISVSNRKLIKAVRFAVVARNAKMNPGYVSSTCSTAKGVVNNGPCAWDDANFDPAPQIDLSADYALWRQFNYRVFETIIPLRNVIWSASTLP